MAEIDIGIDERERTEVAERLSQLLADTYQLYFMTHGFHWNVTGPMFQQLHELFEEEYTELWNAVDVIAERIRALDVFAPSSYAKIAELSRIEIPDEVPPAQEMLRHLLDGHESVARTARAAFPVAEEADDEATQDLLTQRLRAHEKAAWMLRSMLH